MSTTNSMPQSSSRDGKDMSQGERRQNDTISSHHAKEAAPTSSSPSSPSRSARFARSLRFKKKKESTLVAPVENSETGGNKNDNHDKSVNKGKNRLRALSHRIMHPVKHSKTKKKKQQQQQNNGKENPFSSSSLAAEVDEDEEEEDVSSSSETNPNEENSSAEEEEKHAVETYAMGGHNHEEEEDNNDDVEEEEEQHELQPESVLSRAAFSDNEDAIEKDRGHLGFGNNNEESGGDSGDDSGSDSSDDEKGEEKDDSNSHDIHEEDRIVLSHGKPKKCDKKQFKKKKKGKKNALKKKVHKSDEILFPGDSSSKHKKKNKKDAKKSDKKISLNNPEEVNRLQSFMNKQLMNGPQFGDSLVSGEAKRPSDFADNAHSNRGDSHTRTVEEILMLQDYSDFYDRPDANPTYVYSENDDAAKSIIRQHLMKPVPDGTSSQPSSLSSLPVPGVEQITTQTAKGTPNEAPL